MEKKKKGISCSYAVLVIILFAALAFVTDYAFIQNKMQTCPSNIAKENNDSKQYTYSDLTGFYQATFTNTQNLEYPENLELYLYDDATFYYTCSSHAFAGSIGTYTIEGNKIILNYLFYHGSDVGTGTQYKKEIATFNDNYEITLDFLPSSPEQFTRESINFSRTEKYDNSNTDSSLVKKRLNETELFNEFMSGTNYMNN